jgi:hypothetical protein
MTWGDASLRSRCQDLNRTSDDPPKRKRMSVRKRKSDLMRKRRRPDGNCRCDVQSNMTGLQSLLGE